MTTWIPDLANHAGPRYRAIAEAMADAIATGSLPPGTRLPTHRDLAWRLGVTVGTVTRAYKEATARGLIDGEIGRGTFVRDARTRGWGSVAETDDAPVDFGLNFPPCLDRAEEALRETLAAIAVDPAGLGLAAYDPSGGRRSHREAIARWLRSLGLPDADGDSVLVTAGAQHGIATALMAAAEPGDVVLAERLTHPGFKALAADLKLRVVGIEMDDGGVLPDALDAAVRLHRPKAVFLIPTLQNPTTAVMDEARRDAVADVLGRHETLLIEDDLYRFFAETPPVPIAARIPERSAYVTSASKHLAPGLRIGALRLPSRLRQRATASIRNMLWVVPPLMTEIFVRWLADGTADRLAEIKRREQAARMAAARRRLGNLVVAASSASPHLWLTLPETWEGGAAAASLVEQGVIVTVGEVFEAAPGAGRGYLRVALGRPRDLATVDRGLALMAATLRRDPTPDRAVV